MWAFLKAQAPYRAGESAGSLAREDERENIRKV